MMLTIWVFALMGQPLAGDHGTPYVQVTASDTAHSTPRMREAIEKECRTKFVHDFPGRAISCECGWAQQKVEVNKA